MFKRSLVFSIFLSLFLMPISTSILFAQSKLVTGVVTSSETQQPISGVSVLLKGTKKGTTTDAQGKFSINIIDAKSVLVFTYSSYVEKEIMVGDKTVLSIVLSVDIKSIEDVVVIGYQSVKRKDALASVSSVTARDLKDIPINSAAEALNGRLAGVTASTAEGSPDADIRIREIGRAHV